MISIYHHKKDLYQVSVKKRNIILSAFIQVVEVQNKQLLKIVLKIRQFEFTIKMNRKLNDYKRIFKNIF